MKYLCLCCAGLLLALSAVAQRNYVPATVLLPGGDSLTGQIDYRKWDANPLTISFRESEGFPVKDYTAADIKGFRIAENNEAYLSLPAELDVTNETVDVLSNSSDRDVIRGDHFFRVLMDGPVKLLLYADRFHRQHFVLLEKGAATQLLTKQVFISDRESPNYSKIKTHYFYRQQLAVALEGCVAPQRLAGLEYSETALRRVLQQYTACRYPGEQVVVRKEDGAMRATLGVMGGAGVNMVNVQGTHPMASGKFTAGTTPVFGVFLDVPISRNRQKLSWNNEVIFTSRPVKGSWSRVGYLNEADINLQYLQIQTLVKYTFPKGNLRPYFNAGVAGAISIGGKDELVKTRESAGTKSTELALEGGRDFFLPLMAGVGVRYNKLHVEARFTAPHNLSIYRTLDVMYYTGQLLVRYSVF